MVCCGVVLTFEDKRCCLSRAPATNFWKRDGGHNAIYQPSDCYLSPSHVHHHHQHKKTPSRHLIVFRQCSSTGGLSQARFKWSLFCSRCTTNAKARGICHNHGANNLCSAPGIWVVRTHLTSLICGEIFNFFLFHCNKQFIITE